MLVRLAKQSFKSFFKIICHRRPWKNIAHEFDDLLQSPHMICMIYEKHVVTEAPAKSGTFCHNCKGTFSIILLVLCDDKYNSTLVDVG